MSSLQTYMRFSVMTILKNMSSKNNLRNMIDFSKYHDLFRSIEWNDNRESVGKGSSIITLRMGNLVNCCVIWHQWCSWLPQNKDYKKLSFWYWARLWVRDSFYLWKSSQTLSLIPLDVRPNWNLHSTRGIEAARIFEASLKETGGYHILNEVVNNIGSSIDQSENVVDESKMHKILR